jgi:preprotein translocase subunit SecF
VTADDEEIADEVRRERAYAAAASVPARTPKASQNRKPGRPTGKRKR